MKKILFLFLMVFGLTGSLYALDTEQTVVCDIEKSQTLNKVDATTTPSIGITLSKVHILHRDTLICRLQTTTRPYNMAKVRDFDNNKQIDNISGYSGGYSSPMVRFGS